MNIISEEAARTGLK